MSILTFAGPMRPGRWLLVAALVLSLSHTAAWAQEVIPDYYNEPGLNPNRAYINQAEHEYVDPFNGALQLHYVDIHLPGNGKFDLEVIRSYNSSAVTPLGSSPPLDHYPVGLGWTLHFGRVLAKTGTLPCAGTPAFDTRNNPVLELPDGSRQLLVYTATGSPLMLTTRRWRADCATTDSIAGFVIYSPEGTRYEMTRLMVGITGPSPSPLHAWYTTRIVDRNGNSATITYTPGTGPAEIQSITTSDGRSLTFTYSGGLIREIAGAPGQTYRYGYTSIAGGQSQLTSVTRPDDTQWLYAYNGPVANDTGGGSFALSRLTHPQGGSVAYTYGKLLFNSLATTYTSVIATRTVGMDVWTYAFTPGAAGQLDTTVVTGPEGVTRYRHIGVNCTAPNSTCGGAGDSDGETDVFLYAVGALVSKEIGSIQTESYGYTGQEISPQSYAVPGLWGTWLVDGVYAPVMTVRGIARDEAGYSTIYSSFDAYGNPGRVTEIGPFADSPGRITEYTYFIDSSKWIVGLAKDMHVTGLDGLVSSTTRVFDANGNVRTLTRDRVTTSYDYDGEGNVIGTTLPGNRTYAYGSYRRGIPQVENQPEGITITREVSDAGNVIAETNGNLLTTRYGYDGLNRVTSVAYPAGSGVTITYGAHSKVATRGALTESTTYDGFARPVSVTLGEIGRTYRYDALGRMMFASDPNGSGGVGYEYDILGRLVRVTNQDGSYVATTFGPGTRTVTDERGNATTYYLRGYGDPDKTHLLAIAPSEPNTQMIVARNGLDQVTSISQGAYNAVLERTFEYDDRGYLVSAFNPETGATTYGRDDAGNMISRQVGASGVTTFAYDGQNRLRSIMYPGTTPGITKTWTKTSKLDTVTASGGSRRFRYDDNDNLTGETIQVGGQSFDIGYGYDGLDHLAAVTYPVSSSVVSYAPDPLGRPTQASAYVSNVTYWPSGQIKDIHHGNGTVTSYGQNERLWPSGLTTRNSSGIAYLDSGYSYDPAGNLVRIAEATDASFNRTLGYDKANRLTRADGPWGVGIIAYDGAGNVGYQSLGSAANIGYLYDNNNRLAQVQGPVATSVGYDAYGNVASAYGNTYTYDDVPNLACVNCSDPANSVTYTYDGLNLRSSTTKGGVTTYEIHASNGQLLAEYTPGLAGKLVESIYVGSRRVAQRRTGGLAMTTSSVGLAITPAVTLVGDAVTITATISGSSPTGTVTFKDGAATLGTAFVSGGVATFSTTVLDPGDHTIKALYSGDVANGPSEAAVPYTVRSRIRKVILLAASYPGPVYPGDTVAVAVTVIEGFNPTGSVTYSEGGVVLGVAPLVNGTAKLDLQLAAGSHAIRVDYSGDAFNYPGGGTATITTSLPRFVFGGPNGAVAVGQPVVLAAEVMDAVDCDGTVTFEAGGRVLGIVDNCALQRAGLATNKSQVVARFDTLGVHHVVATYRSLDGRMEVGASGSVTVQDRDSPAEFTLVTDVEFDGAGNLYIAEEQRIRKLTPAGDVVSVVGAPPGPSIVLAPEGNGVSAGARFCGGLAIDGSGNLYANGGDRIYRITPEADMTVFYDASGDGDDGLGGTAGCASSIGGGLALDAGGNLYVAQPGNHTIRKISPAGVMTIFAGAAGVAGSIDGTGASARFQWPTGLAFDASGQLYVADAYDGTIRKITPAGAVTTYAGRAGRRGMVNGPLATARFAAPIGLAFDREGNLLVSEKSSQPWQGNWFGNNDLRKITPAGIVTSVAGFRDDYGFDWGYDGIGLEAQFSGPGGIAVDAAGTTYVADGYAVRRVTPTGTVTTVAGRGDPAGCGTCGADGRMNDITLVVTPSLPMGGQEVTMVATVTGAGPTGTVTFYDDTAILGTGSLVGATATFVTTALGPGQHLLKGAYGGDGKNRSSTSAITRLNVGRTTTALTASPSPAAVGQSVTLTATVSDPAASGEISFQHSWSLLGTVPVVGGRAQLVIADVGDYADIPEGADSGLCIVWADYNGDSRHQPSSSSEVSVTVYTSRSASTTTLSATPNPAAYGGTVTLTASVTGSTPTGTVTFLDGATPIATAAISAGRATLTTSSLAVGTHGVTASYGGDARNNGSTSSAVALTINKATTTTALTASPSPAAPGQAVTLTATVTGRSPGGSVTFKDGATTLGTAEVASGKAAFTTSTLAAGSHSLSASYGGDGNNNASTSATVSLTVTKVATTTTLAASPSPSTYGSPVTLTAAVTGPNPTGAVTFKNGTTTLGTASVTAGRATLTTAALAVGTRSLTASYGGDGSHAGSTSSVVSLVIAKATTGTVLTVSPNPANYGTTVSLSAVVTGVGPTGTVTFKDGTKTLGSKTLSSGKATYTTKTLARGSHSLTASYGGNTNNGVSASAAVSLTVK